MELYMNYITKRLIKNKLDFFYKSKLSSFKIPI